ncbi:MAG: hypothetical protein JWM11_2867 [Planctomycetaceae bacterium]|nr:hypothetical protein [Planctomycetaceae bacterium]
MNLNSEEFQASIFANVLNLLEILQEFSLELRTIIAIVTLVATCGRLGDGLIQVHFLPPFQQSRIGRFERLLEVQLGFDVFTAGAVTVFTLLSQQVRSHGGRSEPRFERDNFLGIPASHVTRQAFHVMDSRDPFAFIVGPALDQAFVSM